VFHGNARCRYLEELLAWQRLQQRLKELQDGFFPSVQLEAVIVDEEVELVVDERI